MDGIFIRSKLSAPVPVVWQALRDMSAYDTGLTAGVTEVLGGQPPTYLSFRLLSGAPVRRNVVSVQLFPGAPGSTEVFVDGAFQPSLAGAGGLARRRVRRLLVELTERLEAAVRAGEHPSSRVDLDAAAVS
ncbi:hypothetical protein [Nocardioides antri]|uniref:SRPBCC family protein n=1 Tax=Nocardioides antri TaxID=2607659 RepID=A0A5B1M3B1_9ACTN|nr:hypothetical protein [Nocardioides antri]KAA1427402.1 hypothetical protein F0U47_07955 [Nocardioides antri]